MKKRIIIISVLLLFLTGCTCEYNLTIDGDIYREEVSIIGTTTTEVSEFNKKWEVPTDKEEYNVGLDPDATVEFSSDIYEYKLSGNTLKFNHDFSLDEYQNSSAVSNCYDMLNVIKYGKNTLISSSSHATCFEKYPDIDNIKVSVKVDRNVTSHNADTVNGNIYIWNITKDNASTKSINMALDNSTSQGNNTTTTSSATTTTKQAEKQSETEGKYTMYIFYGILLISFLIGYFICNMIIKRSDKMND